MIRSRTRSRLIATAGFLALAPFVACTDDAPDARTSLARPSKAASHAASGKDAANRAPIVVSVTLSPDEPSATDTVRAAVELSDPDGDYTSAHYTWWVNGQRAGTGASFEPAAAAAARGSRIEVSVIADDGDLQSEPETAAVTLGNSAPTISSIRFEPSGSWFAGQSVAALPDASDRDADPLSFEYNWLVNGQRIDETGPTLDGSIIERGDEVILEVVASDGHARSEVFRSEEIVVANAAPEITSQPGSIGADGVFRYTLNVRDPDGDRAFEYKLLQAPTGAEMDRLEGKLVWQPEEAQSGSQAFVLEVHDRKGGRTTQKFTLDVFFDDGRSAPASPR